MQHYTNSNHAIVILAAGKSTRFPISKINAMLAGKRLIDYSIQTAKHVTKHVYVVTQPAITQLAAHVIHQIHPDGTGGALIQALKSMPDFDQITVMLADTPFITAQTLFKLVDKNCAAITNHLNQAGKLLIHDKIITAICEYKDPEYAYFESDYTWAGAVNFNLSTAQLLQLLESLPRQFGEIYLTDIFPILRMQTHFISQEEGLGINNVHDYQQAEILIQQQLLQQALEQGAFFIDSASVKLGHGCQFEAGAIIHPFTHISNSYIKSNSQIMPFSVVETSMIDGTVGPFAHARAGTILHTHAHLGSFVETKNTVLGAHSKAKHLSYIGDCTIGANTNIGAGVITCNYNKATCTKSLTHIGDNCDIGANSSLVAPLQIGSNSQIGAGSVITKSVEDNQLAVSRTKQKNLRKLG